MGQGAALSMITAEICARLGVVAQVMPMTDDPVRSRITTPDGVRTFQEYLVKHGAAEQIESIVFEGIDAAVPAPGVLEAIAEAETIVICPSSPVVSIGTILAVPGVREAVAARREDCVAISPIIGRRPVEGPAHRFLAGAGYPECSATQMARIYADVAATFVLDAQDAAEVPDIEAVGVRAVLTDALMPDRAARARLAGEVLEAVR
jgi:LPPG:FO 2-phospho-L-lactate transferase